MNETLLSSAWHHVCDSLREIKRSGEWRDYDSFDEYVVERWGISKTRGRMLVKFSTFAEMCREESLDEPESPDIVQPILALPQKRWVYAWAYCVGTAEGTITKKHVIAVLERFAIYAKKRWTQDVRDKISAAQAAKNLKRIKDLNSIQRPDQWDNETFEKAARLWERNANG